MVINPDFIFIHIPKTGGTSCTDYLCQSLSPPIFCFSIKSMFKDTHFNARLLSGYSHETLEEVYSDKDRIKLETGIDVTTINHLIAVIRHPYDLELSNYLFFRNGRNNVLKGEAFQVPHILEKVQLAQGEFCDFVRASGYFRENENGNGFRTEDYFLINGKIPENVTLLRFEELEEKFTSVVAPFCTNPPLAFPHSNKSASFKEMSVADIDEPTKLAIYQKHRWLFDAGYYRR
jgi:hypothetical protein